MRRHIYICMDGLGGLPAETFKLLKMRLEAKGHEVVLARIKGIRTHEDRVRRVMDLFLGRQTRAKEAGQKIFLVGQSAGGSAVRIAASRLKGQEELAGVILLSQAMPRGVWFMTVQLLRSMLGQIKNLLLAWTIHTSEAEYARLVEPLPADQRNDVIFSRQPLPGPESRELAFWAPMLQAYDCPTLYIWGDKDHWISVTAHRKLCGLLRQKCADVSHLEVPGSGHLTLASEKRDEVISLIMEWTENK